MYITNDMVKPELRVEFVSLLTRQAELLADLATSLDAVSLFSMRVKLESVELRMADCMV